MSVLRNSLAMATLERNRRLTPGKLRTLQDRKLRELVSHAWEKVPFYRRLFEEAGPHPSDIRGTDDLH